MSFYVLTQIPGKKVGSHSNCTIAPRLWGCHFAFSQYFGKAGWKSLLSVNSQSSQVIIRAQICKRLRSPGIYSKESIPPGYIGWRNHTLESIHGLLQCLQIRPLAIQAGKINSLESIPWLLRSFTIPFLFHVLCHGGGGGCLVTCYTSEPFARQREMGSVFIQTFFAFSTAGNEALNSFFSSHF